MQKKIKNWQNSFFFPKDIFDDFISFSLIGIKPRKFSQRAEIFLKAGRARPKAR